VTPQNANHYSLAQVQVNNYKHSVYNKWEFYATLFSFYSVIQYNAITLSVLLKGIILISYSLWCIQQFQV